jgi:hypothetical protein
MRRGWWCGTFGEADISTRRHIVAVVLGGLLAMLALAPARALAEPLCTDTWTGPSEGNWASAEDWSSGVPTSSSVACIGAGKTVTIREAAFAGVLEDDGGLSIEFGSLDLTDVLEPSSVAGLGLADGSLVGPAPVSVSTALVAVDNDTINAGGSLSILSGASASIYGAITVSEAATLINEGTLTIPSSAGGSFNLREGAEITNAGTFNVNSDLANAVGSEEVGAESRFVNTGILQTSLTERHGTILRIDFDNEGVVNAKAGELRFSKSAESHGVSKWESEGGEILFREAAIALTGGEWAGSIVFEDSNGTIEGVNATSAQVTVSFSTLSVPSGTVSVEELSLVSSYSTLGGAGSVVVTKTLDWSSAELTGTGTLTLRPSGTGTISGGARMHAHTLVNEGSINFPEGYIEIQEGGSLDNLGAFTANDVTGSGLGGATGNIANSGTFQVTVPGTVNVENFTNAGVVKEENEGHFHFINPVKAEASNQYGAQETRPDPIGRARSAVSQWSSRREISLRRRAISSWVAVVPASI